VENSDVLSALISSELKVAMSTVSTGKVVLNTRFVLEPLTDETGSAIFLSLEVNLIPSKQ
jgi:hypothetical protein